MRRELERARTETSGRKVYALATYYFVTGNYSLVVVLWGLLLIGLGATIISGRPAVLFDVVNAIPNASIDWLHHDVFAGMFGVWGATFVVIGGTAYLLMWINKLYAELTVESESESESETELDGDADTDLL